MGTVPVHGCETPICAYAAMGTLVELIGADLGRRPVAVPLDDPGPVVGLLEGLERQAKLLDGREVADPQQVLLQGPDEAFGAAIALGFPHESRRACEAEEADLALEVVAQVLGAVIVAKRETVGGVVAEGAEALAHALT